MRINRIDLCPDSRMLSESVAACPLSLVGLVDAPISAIERGLNIASRSNEGSCSLWSCFLWSCSLWSFPQTRRFTSGYGRKKRK